MEPLRWDELTSLTAPWAFLVACPADELVAIGGEAPKGARVWLLRGERCRDRDAFFAEVSRELQFPQYFGKNWGSVTDCLHDLEWAPASSYTLIVADAQAAFAGDDAGFANLLDVLRDATSYWRSTDDANPWQDARPAPFHTILHCEPGAADALRARVERAAPDIAERELRPAAPA